MDETLEVNKLCGVCAHYPKLLMFCPVGDKNAPSDSQSCNHFVLHSCFEPNESVKRKNFMLGDCVYNVWDVCEHPRQSHMARGKRYFHKCQAPCDLYEKSIVLKPLV